MSKVIHGAFSQAQRSKDLRRILLRMKRYFGIKSVYDLTGEQRMHLDLFCDAFRLVERLDVVDSNNDATSNAATFSAALGGWYSYVTPGEVPLDQRRVARRAVLRGCELLDIPEPRIRWFAPAYEDTPGAFFVGHEFGGRVFPERLFEIELLACTNSGAGAWFVTRQTARGARLMRNGGQPRC